MAVGPRLRALRRSCQCQPFWRFHFLRQLLLATLAQHSCYSHQMNWVNCHDHGIVNIVMTIIIIRRHCSRTSDSTYSYTHLHSVVCLSDCRLSHSCTLRKLFDGFRCHLAGTPVGLMTRCVRWCPWPARKAVSSMLPPGKYKRAVGWTCDSDLPVTLVVVVTALMCAGTLWWCIKLLFVLSLGPWQHVERRRDTLLEYVECLPLCAVTCRRLGGWIQLTARPRSRSFQSTCSGQQQLGQVSLLPVLVVAW